MGEMKEIIIVVRGAGAGRWIKEKDIGEAIKNRLY